jgi:DnaK suppressor protein
MTSEDLRRLTAMLEEEQVQIESELAEFAVRNPLIKDDYVTHIEPAENSEEKAEKLADYAVNKSEEEVLETRLRDVEKALERIEAETYGICSKCGLEIELERLEALPSANLCATCAGL